MQENAKKQKKHSIFTMNDSLASLVWISEHKPLYSVWQDPSLYMQDLQITGKSQKFPCSNFYCSMVFDKGSKIFMCDGCLNTVDLFDLEKGVIKENFMNIDEELAKTLVVRLVLKDQDKLLGITKDSSYFVIDLRTKKIVQNKKLPFRILCHDYQTNYEKLALGVKYKGKYSHIDLNINGILKGEYNGAEVLKEKIEGQIINDDVFSPEERIYSIAFSKSCRYKALGTKGKIYLYKTENNEDYGLECAFKTHCIEEIDKKPISYNVNKVRFFPLLESLLTSAGGDGYLQFYNVERRENSKKSLSMKSKEKNEDLDHLNGFSDVGWNCEGSWMYYTKGYDWKFGDLQNDPRKELIRNKIYFQEMDTFLQNESIKSLL